MRWLFLSLLLVASPVWANGQKFSVTGDRLVYDTINVSEAEEDIAHEDVDALSNALEQNPGIRLLEVNSYGGSLWAAQHMKDIVIDYELDTHVNGHCDSSCITIFLAGNNRTMSRGSRLGFHQFYWASDYIASYYEDEKDAREWNTPFDMAEWMYRDTQSEIYVHLTYMISRGVDPQFAIQTIRDPDGSIWRPYRAVLRAAGVLTE